MTDLMIIAVLVVIVGLAARYVIKAKKSGAKYFFVEQDNAPEADDPFGQVERSIKYIREVL